MENVRIEATIDEWVILRQILTRGCAHLGAELSNIGAAGAGVAARILGVISVMDARIEKVVSIHTADSTE